MCNLKPSPPFLPLHLAVLLAVSWLCVTPARAQTQLEDAIVATVDEAPILVSDIERAIALGLAQPNEGEDDDAFRRRVLQELIDDRLRVQEVERFGFEELPLDAIEAEVAAVRARFDSEEAFRRHLRRLDLNEDDLRQLVTRQLLVLIYVEERLGPRIFVDNADVETYYRTVLKPQLTSAGAEIPQLNEVRGQIREVLRQQRLNEEIGDWTQELRQAADIQKFQDHLRNVELDGLDLPPLVERITEPE